MQIASRQIVWNEGGRGTVVEVEMTPTTGLRLRFLVRAINQDAFSVAWGEGKREDVAYRTGDIYVEHTTLQGFEFIDFEEKINEK